MINMRALLFILRKPPLSEVMSPRFLRCVKHEEGRHNPLPSTAFRNYCDVWVEGHSPPRRGGVDAPSEAKAQTGWSDRLTRFAELTINCGFVLLLRLRAIALALRAGSRFAPGAPASIKLPRHPSSARREFAPPNAEQKNFFCLRCLLVASSSCPAVSVQWPRPPNWFPQRKSIGAGRREIHSRSNAELERNAT